MKTIRLSLPVLALMVLLGVPAAAQPTQTHLGAHVRDLVTLQWAPGFCSFHRVFPNRRLESAAFEVPAGRALIITDYTLNYEDATPNPGPSVNVSVVLVPPDAPPTGTPFLANFLVSIDRNGNGSLHVSETTGIVAATSAGSQISLFGFTGICGDADALQRCVGCQVRGYLIDLPLLFIPPGLRP